MRTEESIKKAMKVREEEHHLRPQLKLDTISQLERFIHKEQLVSVFGGNELPSIINAILGREWKPSKKGFTSWDEWWSIKISGESVARVLGRLDRSQDIVSTKIFRKTKTLVSKKLWPILDPIVSHYLEQAKKHRIFTELEWKILEALAKGPIRTDLLRKHLKLEHRKFSSRYHRSLALLESYALIVGYEDPKPERHLHANIWQLWTDRIHARNKGFSYDEALAKMLETTVDTCIIVRKDKIGEWFQWETRLSEAMTRPFESGKVTVAGDYLIASRIL